MKNLGDAFRAIAGSSLFATYPGADDAAWRRWCILRSGSQRTFELNLRRVRPELRNPNRIADSILTYSSGEPQGIGDAFGSAIFPMAARKQTAPEEELARNRKCPTGSGPLSPEDLRLCSGQSAAVLANRTLSHGGGLGRKVPRAKRTRIRKRFEIKLQPSARGADSYFASMVAQCSKPTIDL